MQPDPDNDSTISSTDLPAAPLESDGGAHEPFPEPIRGHVRTDDEGEIANPMSAEALATNIRQAQKGCAVAWPAPTDKLRANVGSILALGAATGATVMEELHDGAAGFTFTFAAGQAAAFQGGAWGSSLDRWIVEVFASVGLRHARAIVKGHADAAAALALASGEEPVETPEAARDRALCEALIAFVQTRAGPVHVLLRRLFRDDVRGTRGRLNTDDALAGEGNVLDPLDTEATETAPEPELTWAEIAAQLAQAGGVMWGEAGDYDTALMLGVARDEVEELKARHLCAEHVDKITGMPESAARVLVIEHPFVMGSLLRRYVTARNVALRADAAVAAVKARSDDDDLLAP